MNVQTVMRMAAAGAGSYDPAEWVQVRLAMMDTVAPWQDPDGAFISMVEDAAGWTLTVDYNGAGGQNASWPNMIAWKTASVASVIPQRVGPMTGLHLVEWCGVSPTLPADSAAWTPVGAVGIMWDGLSSRALGGGTSPRTATAARAIAVGGASGAVQSNNDTTTVRAGQGGIWPGVFSSGVKTTGAQCFAHYTLAGVLVTTNLPSSNMLETATVVGATSQVIVGFGNITNNPAAAVRSATYRFYLRIFDLTFTSPAAWVDSTGWTSISPSEFGDPAIPAQDPNGVLTSFDATAPPAWRPTIDDTGIPAMDGMDEGVLWATTPPAGFPVGDAPLFICTQPVTWPAYANTRQMMFAGGQFETVDANAGMSLGFGASSATQARPIIMVGLTDTPGTQSLFPSVMNGSVGWIYPKNDLTTFICGGGIGRSLLGAVPLGNLGPSQNSTTVLSGAGDPKMCVAIGTNAAGNGTSSAALEFNLWWATAQDYVWSFGGA